MGLCPSNDVSGGFPTLGDPPFGEAEHDLALAELAGLPRGSTIVTSREREVLKRGSERYKLAQVGITVGGLKKNVDDTEWVKLYTVEASAWGWRFHRAWYYWIAVAENQRYFVPADTAMVLHERWGSVVRTDGFAGGKVPDGPVDSYHIDTPDGLAALIEVLKEIVPWHRTT